MFIQLCFLVLISRSIASYMEQPRELEAYEHPYVGFLKRGTDVLGICTLIAVFDCVTQAHIVFDVPLDYRVFGFASKSIHENDASKYAIKGVTVHPKFQPGSGNDYNIALVHLDNSFKYTLPISRDVKYTPDADEFPNHRVTVRSAFIVYWVLVEKTYVKHIARFMPNRLSYTPDCPTNLTSNYFCITKGSDVPFEKVVLPCEENGIAQAAPVIFNTQMHGMVIGPIGRNCTLSQESGDISIIDPIIVASVVYVRADRIIDPKFRIFTKFLDEHCQKYQAYDFTALYGDNPLLTPKPTQAKKTNATTKESLKGIIMSDKFKECILEGSAEKLELKFVFMIVIFTLINQFYF